MSDRVKQLLIGTVLCMGFSFVFSPAFAATTLLIGENFNDVNGINAAGGARTVADILANDSGQLPDGTTAISSGASPNVRRADNEINTTGGDAGFDHFFTSKFLVLGDDAGPIGGNPSGAAEGTEVRFPFVIPIGALFLHVSFDLAFDGIDTATNRADHLIVSLTDGVTAIATLDLRSPNEFCSCHRSRFFNIFADSDPATLSPGSYELRFQLDESNNGDGITNSAAGVDNVRVRAGLVPEPTSLSLLSSGLVGLAAWSRRKKA